MRETARARPGPAPREGRRKSPRVSDLMSREVITCSPNTDLARVGWLLWEGDCGALPVLLGGEVVGMVTDRDLAIAAAMKPRPCTELRVSEAMSPADLALVRPDATLEEALVVMAGSRAFSRSATSCGIRRRLPVSCSRPWGSSPSRGCARQSSGPAALYQDEASEIVLMSACRIIPG